MNPDDTDHLLLAAYLDGELSPGETIEMERRLDADPELRRLRERLRGLSRSVSLTIAQTPVPPSLRADAAGRFDRIEPIPRPKRGGRWLPAAAMLLVGVLGGSVIGSKLAPLSRGDAAGGQAGVVYAAHLRALAAPQPFDIASSDRHVVKPWFNGRSAIAPDAPDLGPEGFPLVGGRIDIVDGIKVPTLVYKRREHVISVTAVPRGKGDDRPSLRLEGTTILEWDAGDLTYFAVSDLNKKEMDLFADRFRARAAPPS